MSFMVSKKSLEPIFDECTFYVFAEENQASLHKEVSEVKVDVSSSGDQLSPLPKVILLYLLAIGVTLISYSIHSPLL